MAAEDGLRELLQWLEEELDRNRLLVEAFASGKLEVHSWQDGHGMVDTTAREVGPHRHYISEPYFCG